MGGTLLREWSLSDGAVIARISESFVPVWINVTREPIPDVRGVDPMREQWDATEGRPFDRWVLRTFQMKSYVISPDGAELLTPPSMHGAGKPPEYLEMLKTGLDAAARRG